MSDDANTVARPELPDPTASNAHAASTGPRSATPPTLGTRYILGEEIARGGMGAVLRATDTVLNREVAVKVLQERFGLGSATARRFEEEARITGQLQHPNIPAIYDLGTLPDGRPFLAMKLIKGETLEKLLKSNSPSERGRLIAVFEQICQAVAYAHAHEVIHRDLKPANIMVGAFGEVQVMDWGLAKVLSERRDVSSPVSAEGMLPESDDPEATAPATEIRSSREREELLTHAGSVMGTPAYMPPEQAIGAIDQVDQQSDVFGLGGLLTAILTGKPPFVGQTSESTRQMAAMGKLEDCFARLDASGAESELLALCKRCLAHSKEHRPKNAAEIAAEVAKLRLEAEERAREAELEATRTEVTVKEQTKRRRVTYVAGSLLMLTFLVGAIVSLVYASQANRNADRAETNEKLATKRAVEIEAEQGRTKQALKKVSEAEAAVTEKATTLAKTVEDLKIEQENTQQSLAYNRLLLAETTWNGTGTPQYAKELLKQIPERFHNWEHRYLRHKYEGSFATFYGHTDRVWSVTFSPDGSRLASASRDQTIRVWDGKTGQSLLQLRGHASFVGSVSFSPDGTRLASGSADKTIRVWDTKTGQSLHELKGHTGPVESVSFSPDGTRLASGSVDQTIRIWDTTTGRSLLELQGHSDSVISVSFSPDGRRLASGHWDKTIRVWDGKTGQCLLQLQGHKGNVRSVTFSPDGRRLASGSADETIRVWDGKTGQSLLQLKGHTDRVTSVSFSPDGTRLASGSYDQSIRIWDTRTGQSLLELQGHTGRVESVSFSPDGMRLASASADKTIRIWEARPVPQPGEPLSQDELTFRKAMWRPDPIWHRQQLEAAKQVNEIFAEKVQNYLLHKAIAEEHFDYNRFDEALAWHIAAQLLNTKPPVIDWPVPPTELRLRSLVRGEEWPTNNAERLEYARRAYDSMRFSLATRLWTEALTIEPKIAEDRRTKHLYYAACAAALANDGKGRFEPPLDDADKPKLRKQALEWLKAELTLWSQLLEANSQAARSIVQTISHWRRDTDLASIRDKEALAKLPANEQNEFRQLWADVATLLNKAQAKANPVAKPAAKPLELAPAPRLQK